MLLFRILAIVVTVARAQIEPTTSKSPHHDSSVAATSGWDHVPGTSIRMDIEDRPHVVSSQLPTGSDEYVAALEGCQKRDVSLFRISLDGREFLGISRIYQFPVDSTITILVIYVNSARPSNIIICRPDDAHILRGKRSALNEVIISSEEEWPSQDSSQSPRSQRTGNIAWHFTPTSMRAPPVMAANTIGFDCPNRYAGTMQKEPSRLFHKFRLSSYEFSVQQGKWTIQQPEPGMWTLQLPVWFKDIEVKGASCIDFSYEFLDVAEQTHLDFPPPVKTTTLIKIQIEGHQQISGLVYLEMRSKANSALLEYMSLESDDEHQEIPNSLMISHTMPSEPFILRLGGLDAKSNKFQRQSAGFISPTQFSLHFGIAGLQSGYLLQGQVYTGLVEIKNMGPTATFRIYVKVELRKYFDVFLQRNHTIVVEANTTRPFKLSVRTKNLIHIPKTSSLNVTVKRISDDSRQSLSRTIKGAPLVFLSDYKSPVCRSLLVTGGCSSLSPCAQQKWSTVVEVVDAEVGVRGANFVYDPAQKYFNTVQFSYNRRNRTAKATYRSNCCKRQFTLKVWDYHNNVNSCTFHAPPGDERKTTTPSPNNPVHSTPKSTSAQSPTTKNSLFSRFTGITRQSYTSIPETRRSSSPASNSRKNFPWPISTRIFGTPTSTVAVLHPLTTDHAGNSLASVPVVQGSTKMQHHHLSPEKKYSTLSKVTIILGCVGILAFVAIVTISIVRHSMKRRWKRNNNMRRAQRQGSNESDITMGSSWQSSGPTGSCPGSVRSAISLQVLSGLNFGTTDEIDRRGWPSYADSGFYDSGDDSSRNSNSPEGPINGCSNSTRTHYTSQKNLDDDHSVPQLTRAGNTYSSMLELQSKLDEIDRMVGNSGKRSGHDKEEVFREEEMDDRARESQIFYTHSDSHSNSFAPVDSHQTPSQSDRPKLPALQEHVRNSQNARAGHAVGGLSSSDVSLGNDTAPSHIDTDNSPPCGGRQRAYSLVLLREQQSGSQETYTYRKAALLHNVAVVKTKDGLGLVRSFPTRLRATDDRCSEFPYDPVRLSDRREDVRRVLFLSRSTGEVDKCVKDDGSEK